MFYVMRFTSIFLSFRAPVVQQCQGPSRRVDKMSRNENAHSVYGDPSQARGLNLRTNRISRDQRNREKQRNTFLRPPNQRQWLPPYRIEIGDGLDACAKWRKMCVVEGWQIFFQRWQNITIDWVETLTEKKRKTRINQNALWEKHSQGFYFIEYFAKHIEERIQIFQLWKKIITKLEICKIVFFFTAIASTLYSYK